MLTGDRISWDTNQNLFVTYKIKLKLTIDETNDGTCLNYPTTEHQSYASCIEGLMRKRILPVLSCMVPWISPADQCAGPIQRASEEHDNLVEWLDTLIFDAWGGIHFTDGACPLPCSLLSLHSIHLHSGKGSYLELFSKWKLALMMSLNPLFYNVKLRGWVTSSQSTFYHA